MIFSNSLASAKAFSIPLVLAHNQCPSLSQNSLTYPLPTATHSTKFLSFVISSNSSCKSSSPIFCSRLGINVFASSEVSQHRLPTLGISYLPISRRHVRYELLLRMHTELRSLKKLQFAARRECALHSLDILFLLEPRKYVQVILRLY